MARLPRLVVPNQPHHIVQSGIDRQPIFRDPDDYQFFLGWLREAARQFKVALHAYVLLPERLQLLASPVDTVGIGKMMQWVGRHYVPYFNAKYARAGTLWQSRYKATVIDPDHYFLACSLHVELAPLRAGLVAQAADYPWSSAAHHVGTKSDPLISDHPAYWGLSNTPFGREIAYRTLIEQGQSASEAELLEEATSKAWVLGSSGFKTQLAKQVKRRVVPARRGRPKKTDQDASLGKV